MRRLETRRPSARTICKPFLKTSKVVRSLCLTVVGTIPLKTPEPYLDLWSLVKEHELRQAVSEREAQLAEITQSLAEYKHRALQAEVCVFYNMRSDWR